LPEGIDENHEILCQDSRDAGRESNPRSPKYETGLPTN